jgi:eukaryotic-like serine/threonine-protein kinase
VRPSLAKYELLGGLASGGMAEVWLARSLGLAGFEKVVVLKTILPQLAKDPNFIEMFFNEARVAALLNHPNCVQIFDLGEENGTYYIAMEFIEGFSFSRVMRRASNLGEKIPIPVVARVVMDALSGLDSAHRLTDRNGRPLGLVHRDISPDNILVAFNGHTKLVDFGIAKAASQQQPTSLTRTGTVKGKHGYMPPEYLKGLAIDGRADLFALGVVMYRALCGAKPFLGATDAMIVKAILDVPPVPPRKINADLPAALENVVMRALEKDRDRRFESARAMRSAIERAVERPADTEEVGRYMESLWPGSDAERISLNALATGRTSNPSLPLLQPIAVEDVELEGMTAHTTSARKHVLPAKPRLRYLAVGAGLVLMVGIGALARRFLSAPPQSPTEPSPPASLAEMPPVAPASQAKPLAADPQPAKPVPVPAPVATPLSPSPSVEPRPTGKTAHHGLVGRVEITSQPPTTVLWRSKSIGHAPGIVDLPAGNQTLRLVNRELGLDREIRVTVIADRLVRSQATFGKAWLDIRASPWAEVKLDGKPLGTTPLPVQEVYEGHHTLDLANTELGKTKHLDVEVAGGDHRTIRENLE